MGKFRLSPYLVQILVTPLWAVSQAMAHHQPPGVDEVDEFADTPLAAALTHPFSGADHWLAAVAVGWIFLAWGRRTGLQSAVLFAFAMVFGVLAGRAGFRLPMMEAGLALSTVLLGCAVAGARWFSPRSVLAAAAFTGAWHGFAHGMEMPPGAVPWIYASGIAPGFAGIALASGWMASLLPPRARQRSLTRGLGSGVAAAGTLLLLFSYSS